jgi:putative DNA primase/helicase
MTGEHVNGTPTTIEERQAELEEVLAEFLPTPAEEAVSNAYVAQPVDLPDQELLERMFGSRSGEKIRRLWAGDWSDYPSQSEADQALCNHLAFWTGNDPDRIDVLFRASDLFRPKWNREDYAQRTIVAAIGATS